MKNEASKTFDCPIVWIEIDRKIPRYLWSASRLSGEFSPGRKQFIVTNLKANLKSVPTRKSDNVEIVYLQEPERLRKVKNHIKSTSKHLKQNTFWINTISRFFYLFEFAVKNDVEQLVHLESDNVLINSHAINDIFQNEDFEIAYPIQAEGIGCASIFLQKSKKGTLNFLEYIESAETDIFKDDMQLLGEYASKGFAVKALNSNLSHQKPSKVIFDAQYFGKFFFGTDARNLRWPFSNRGISDFRRVDYAPLQIPQKFHLRREQDKSVLQLLGNFEGAEIVNIHFHGKKIPSNLKTFEKALRESLLPRVVFIWKLGKFDLIVFLERLHGFTFRRIRISKQSDLRLR